MKKTPPKNHARPLGTKKGRVAAQAVTPDTLAPAAYLTDAPLAAFLDAQAAVGHGDLSDPVLKNLLKPLDNESPNDIDLAAGGDAEPSSISHPKTNSVSSPQSPDQPARSRIVEINLINDGKARKTKWNFIVYNAQGYRGSVRFSKAFFPKGAAPSTLVLNSDAFGEPKAEASKLSKEERKALRASQPKLTLEQKLAKQEAKTAALREQVAKQLVTA